MGANAQTTVPKYTALTVLPAASMNISAGTGIPVFATTVTRDAAFGGANKVLAEGQTCYLEDANVVQYYDGAAWATVGPTAAPTSGLVVVKAETAFTATENFFADSVFTSSYTNYLFVWTLTTSASGPEMSYQNRVGGVTATGANYNWQRLEGNTSTTSTGGVTSDTSANVGYTADTLQHSATINIFAPQLAAPTNFYTAMASGARQVKTCSGLHTPSTAYDGFIITVSSGTMTGTYTVYGYGKTV